MNRNTLFISLLIAILLINLFAIPAIAADESAESTGFWSSVWQNVVSFFSSDENTLGQAVGVADTCSARGQPACDGACDPGLVACGPGPGEIDGEPGCWYSCSACSTNNQVIATSAGNYYCSVGTWTRCGEHGGLQCPDNSCDEGLAACGAGPGEGYCWYSCTSCEPDREGNIIDTSAGKYICSEGSWVEWTPVSQDDGCGSHGQPQCLSPSTTPVPACDAGLAACDDGTPGEGYCWYSCTSCEPTREGNTIETSTGVRYQCENGQWTVFCGTHGYPTCDGACAEGTACAANTPGEGYCWYDCTSCQDDRAGNIVHTSGGSYYQCVNNQWMNISDSNPACGGHGQPQCPAITPVSTPCDTQQDSRLLACGIGTPGENYCWYDCFACEPTREGNLLVTSTGLRYQCTAGRWVQACGEHEGLQCITGPKCQPGLQACNAGPGNGKCYWCCEDDTGTCGVPPDGAVCQNSNPTAGYYDPDCGGNCPSTVCGGKTAGATVCVADDPSHVYSCSSNAVSCLVPVLLGGAGGICVPPQSCTVANGVASCSCVETRSASTICSDAGARCGTVADKCGKSVSCTNTCVPGEVCDANNHCATPCTDTRSDAQVCGGRECGAVNDNCGITRQCDTCPQGSSCSAAGQCTANCQNDCASAGLRQCVVGTTTQYRICGNYDADSCLEWSTTPQACANGEVCDAGSCVPTTYTCTLTANQTCNATLIGNSTINSTGTCPTGQSCYKCNAGYTLQNGVCVKTPTCGDFFCAPGLSVCVPTNGDMCQATCCAAGSSCVNGACVPVDPPMLCEDTGGEWDDCGSGCGPRTCKNPVPGTMCPAVCKAQCSCPSDAPYWDDALGCIASCGTTCTDSDGGINYPVSGTAIACEDGDVTTGILLDYSFDQDDADGTAIDGAVWDVVGGRFGSGAYLFNGNLSAVAADSFTSPSDYTFEMWILVHAYNGSGTALEGYGTYFVDRTTNTGSVTPLASLKAVGNRFLHQYRTDEGGTIGGVLGGPIRTGEWQHVVWGRKKGTELFIYVDGVKNSTPDIMSGSTPASITIPTPRIGSHRQYPLQGLNGSIDEFRLYNRALSESEIAARFEVACGEPVPDVCSNASVLVEALCEAGTVVTDDYTCPGRCVDGACVNNCNTDADCGRGMACEDGICIVPSGATCTDSDGGINFTVAGTAQNCTRQGDVISCGDEYDDSCAGATLTEYYCGASLSVLNTTTSCAFGCANGACIDGCTLDEDCPVGGRCLGGVCIPPVSGCVDTDGGVNAIVYGEAWNRTEGRFDYCQFAQSSNGELYEAICTGINPAHVPTPCPVGAPYCRYGRCVSENTPACVDSDNGVAPYTYGNVTRAGSPDHGVFTDYCELRVVDNDPNTQPYNDVLSCTGNQECYVRDFTCEGFGELGYADVRCFGGCENGTCLVGGICSDGLDNDGDQLIDYSIDPGCAVPSDDNETDTSDYDNDTCADNVDIFPAIYSVDSDWDTIHDDCDNCPLIANADQADGDSDGIGDACDPDGPPASCTETDSGMDPYVYGSATHCADGNCTTINDTCDSTAYLWESHCNPLVSGAGGPEVTYVPCLFGCSAGACLPESNSPAACMLVSFPGNRLNLREPFSNLIDELSSTQLSGLRSGRITTPEGTSNYTQRLRLGAPYLSSDLQPVAVNYVTNDGADDEIRADYLVVDNVKPFLEYVVLFNPAFEGELEGNLIRDYEDKVLNIAGKDYAIVRASLAASGPVSIVLMGGSTSDNIRENETKQYTINGVTYAVTLLDVIDIAGEPARANFSVNGELLPLLAEGDIDVLSNGMHFGVRDLLVNAREGAATFYLGADKLELSDTDVSDDTFATGAIEINDDIVENGVLRISGSMTGVDTFGINAIAYRITMDSADGSGGVGYVPAGMSVRDVMDDPELLISDQLDIKYLGLLNRSTHSWSVAPSADNKTYLLTMQNAFGTIYTVPFLSVYDDVLRFGTPTSDFVFLDAAPIGVNDTFPISSGPDDDVISGILRFVGYNATTRAVSFNDISTGEQYTVVLSESGAGNLIVGGTTHAVQLQPGGIAVRVDLNGNGLSTSFDNDDIIFFRNDNTPFVLTALLPGDIESYPLTPILSVVGDGNNLSGNGVMNATIALVPRYEEVSFADEVIAFTIGVRNGMLDMVNTFYEGPNNDFVFAPWGHFDIGDASDNSAMQTGMTDFGALITIADGMADTINIDYPLMPRYANALVCVGDMALTPCIDGIDNNNNGLVDYPEDPTCTSINDTEDGICGNGVVETGEQCDDGNAVNRDSCSNTCRRNGGGGGGGGGGGRGGSGDSDGIVGYCVVGFHREGLRCVKDTPAPKPTDSSTKGEPKPVPEPETATIDASFDRAIAVSPLTIIDYEVDVSADDKNRLEDVQVSLDVPEDWEYSGEVDLGDIPAGESRTARFRIVVGGMTDRQASMRLRVSGSNADDLDEVVGVTVDLPKFLVKAKPRLKAYVPSDKIPIYELVYNSGSRPLEGLEIEMNVNDGKKTLTVDFHGTFDVAPGGRKVRIYTMPASQVLGKSAVTSGVLRQAGRDIEMSENKIPPSR